jgi:aspartyl/asparaginyl-tRNA synthetase
MIDTKDYNSLVQKLREFFLRRGYLEVPVQSRLSILAACEDPYTVNKFNWDGTDWPLPQTGQMWLEYELLKHPEYPGVFCISTSYRNEPNPIPGRHEKIFPMFEFESKGDMSHLISLESELLTHLGLDSPTVYDYEKLAKDYKVDILEAEHEEMMAKDISNSVIIQHFPERTSPFWNMKHYKDGIFKKVDVILYGQETIGSAERATDRDEMRHILKRYQKVDIKINYMIYLEKKELKKNYNNICQMNFFQDLVEV